MEHFAYRNCNTRASAPAAARLHHRIPLVLVVLLSLLPTNLHAQSYTARVVGIADGDTITVLDQANRQHRIRLAQIDAPEKHQAFGKRARQALSDYIYGATVRVDVATTDRYGREVATIYRDGTNINAAMVSAGYAWVYTRYAHDPTLRTLEAQARAQRLGLWSDPSPVPPWEFRRGLRSSSKPAAGCGNKTKCSQMASCKEAYHYLNECGLHGLDRDKDGIPCESICR